MAYIGNLPKSTTFAIDTFNGDDVTTNFTLREAPVTTSSILVFVGGIRQHTDAYSLSSATLQFTEAPPTGTSNIQVLFLGLGASPAIPSDGSVTNVKMATGSVTGDKVAVGTLTGNLVASATITGDKIAPATIGSSNLTATGVAAGVYGGATAIPVVTVGTDGRVTSLSNTTIVAGISTAKVFFLSNS